MVNVYKDDERRGEGRGEKGGDFVLNTLSLRVRKT